MSNKVLKRYRVARRVAIVLAALPLFQVQQCGTGVSLVLQNTVNALPNTVFQVLQSIALLPLRLLITGGTLGDDGTGTGQTL